MSIRLSNVSSLRHSYDFVHDQTIDGRSLKCLTVVDEFTQEGLAVRVNRSMTAIDVVRVLGLARLMRSKKVPQG